MAPKVFLIFSYFLVFFFSLNHTITHLGNYKSHFFKIGVNANLEQALSDVFASDVVLQGRSYLFLIFYIWWGLGF
jgi:hypothetical protein